MFISLMTGQTETTEIKMNMRNIITARSVPDKSVSDDFMNAVLSNCTTRIVLPALKEFGSESLPHNFNMAAVGVMKKGMSMSLFSSPGNTVVSGQPCAGKTNLTVELISAVVESNKKEKGNETDFFIYSSAGNVITFRLCRTSTEFECNATTSDTCMTMEQANEKAKELEQSSEAKPVAASLPRPAEGNFGQCRCRPSPRPSVRQQTCGDGTSGAETAGTTSVVYGCPGSENDCSGQFSCAGNTSPPAKNG